jgi:aspartate-semialdehyde dehydrogenase
MDDASMSGTDGLTVAIVGATGSVGQDLLATLQRSRLPVASWRLLATRGTKTPRIQVGDQNVTVHALPEDSRGSPLWEGVDLAFLAVPPTVAAKHGPVLMERDVPVIDLSGALADRAPVAVMAARALDMMTFGENQAAVSPSPAGVLLSTLLGPLRDLGAISARGTLLLSAGVAGRDGVEELSGQVISLFNQGEPPRQVFPTGLAFDLLPQAGTLQDGWTEVEGRAVAEVHAVLGPPAIPIAVTAVVMPLFSGIAVSLYVEFAVTPDLETIRTVLAAVPTLQVGDPAPGPRRLAGKPQAVVGRLRLDPAGAGLHLWAAADNLRFGASSNALSIALALWRDGRL